jgi:hypothetical protein
MWNVKAKVTPVILVVTGTTSKSLINYPSKVLGENKIKELKQEPYWALITYLRKF